MVRVTVGRTQAIHTSHMWKTKDKNCGTLSVDLVQAWLPDCYSQNFRLYAFDPLGLKDYGSAVLRCKI